MDRRSFLKNTALGGSAAAATTLAAPAYAQGNRTLTMVTTWGRGLAGVFDAAQRAADNINGMADGALTIEVKGAGELVGAFEVFDAVTAGQADLYHGADYYFVGQHPAYAFFTSVPFGMTAQELVNWYYHDGGAAFHDELGEIFGLKSFLAGNTGAQMGGWFRKEINSLDDLVGLKMRIPGQGGDVLRALGGSSIAIPGGEIYQSLQTGAIDATEWVGPWNDYYLGFYREAPYYYGPGFHEPGSSLACGINRRVWDNFSPGEQAVIKAACESVNHTSLGEFTYQNSVHLDLLVNEHNVQLRSFPPEVVTAMAEAAWDVRAASGKDGIEKRIYESFEKSLKLMRGWSTISDGAYYAARDANK